MSSDKRTVATDALETLGTIITEAEKRDAIHLAVEPVIAEHTLSPGRHVGRYPSGRYGISDNPIGIVDPFLKESVHPGERFWLVVYPRQITSLRHVWTHPAFDEEVKPEPTTAAEPISPEFYVQAMWDKIANEIDRQVTEKIKANAEPTEPPAVAAAKKWIEQYATNIDRTYDGLMRAAKRWIDHYDYWVGGGEFEGMGTADEFWEKYETITGVKGEGNFFTCSC